MRIADRLVLHRAQSESLHRVVGRLLEAAVVEHQGFGLAIFEEQFAIIGAFKPASDDLAHLAAIKSGTVDKRGWVMS